MNVMLIEYSVIPKIGLTSEILGRRTQHSGPWFCSPPSELNPAHPLQSVWDGLSGLGIKLQHNRGVELDVLRERLFLHLLAEILEN